MRKNEIPQNFTLSLNSRSNAEGVSCFLEQELLKGMDKHSAVNPIPEPKNCASLLACRGKRIAAQ